MSHFVANTISISKDLQSFKVKGGDNNVIPRSNYWSNDIPIESLYYEINSGNINLISKTEKALFIDHLVHSMDFGGSWEGQTDYFHMQGLPKTKEEMSKVVDECATTAFDTGNKYYKDILESKTKIYEDFDYWRKKLDDFNHAFLTKLKEGLSNMPKDKYIIQSNGWNKGYIYKLHGRRNASIGSSLDHAMRFPHFRALLEQKRFDDTVLIKL